VAAARRQGLLFCWVRLLLLLAGCQAVPGGLPVAVPHASRGGSHPGEGADFLIGEVTETITRVRTEQGLLTYLSCLKALGGAVHLESLKSITRLRLQSELYSLTSPGGLGPRRERWLTCLPAAGLLAANLLSKVSVDVFRDLWR